MSARSRLALDVALFTGFIAAYYPSATGIPFHEWLAVAITVPLLVHLVLSADWVVRVVRALFTRLKAATGVNLAVDSALFLSAVTTMVSGFMVSQVVARAVGLSLQPAALWYQVHSVSAWSSVVILLLHFSLHAKWASSVVTRMLPLGARASQRVRVRPSLTPAPSRVTLSTRKESPSWNAR